MKYLVHSVLNKTMRLLLEIVNGPRITLNLPTLSGVQVRFRISQYSGIWISLYPLLFGLTNKHDKMGALIADDLIKRPSSHVPFFAK